MVARRENEKKDGVDKHYCRSGDIFSKMPYTNGKINGIVKVYYKGNRLIWQANAQNSKLISGKCANGKAFTNAHLTRLANEINQNITGGDYWYDICEK